MRSWTTGTTFAVAGRASAGTGRAERELAVQPVETKTQPGGRRITLGADMVDGTADVVSRLREMSVAPHVVQNSTRRPSATGGRTTRRGGYAVNKRERGGVEKVLGRLKAVDLLRRVKYRGLERVDWLFGFGLAAYDFVRIRNLTIAAAQ